MVISAGLDSLVHYILYNDQINARALIVNPLWVIVPVNPRKNHASSELLYKSNRPQVFYEL